jgi:hypothetical protein
MKKMVYLLAIILITNISCEKEKEIVPDNILFSNFCNPIVKSTVKDWKPYYPGGPMVIPVPIDSTTSVFLDINNDLVNDFVINLSHGEFIYSICPGHTSFYCYYINIKGINSSDYIRSINRYGQNYSEYFRNGETIEFDNSWTNEAILVEKEDCPAVLVEIEDAYIGFKHNNQLGWIKIKPVSNNGLAIENYAINLTNKRKILAGQIK